MIRVTIELVPHGIESKARVMARGVISNDGTGTLDRGNYLFCLSKVNRLRTTGRVGELKGFPRKSQNVWRLLQRCLNAAYGPKEA